MVIAHSGLCDDVKNTIYQTPAQGQVCWNYMYILIVFHLLSTDCKGDRAKSKGTHFVAAGLGKAQSSTASCCLTRMRDWSRKETLVPQRAILTEAEVLFFSFKSVKVAALNVESLY